MRECGAVEYAHFIISEIISRKQYSQPSKTKKTRTKTKKSHAKITT